MGRDERTGARRIGELLNS